MACSLVLDTPVETAPGPGTGLTGEVGRELEVRVRAPELGELGRRLRLAALRPEAADVLDPRLRACGSPTAPLRATRAPADRRARGPAAGTPMRRPPAPSAARPSARARGAGAGAAAAARRPAAVPGAASVCAGRDVAQARPRAAAALRRGRRALGCDACGVGASRPIRRTRLGARRRRGARGAGADPPARCAAAASGCASVRAAGARLSRPRAARRSSAAAPLRRRRAAVAPRPAPSPSASRR